jgi:predicted phosphodiesterase
MSRYGIIGDVHGNLAALRAVWENLTGLGLDTSPVLNAGDTVAYGPASEECIQFLRSRSNTIHVSGNYDRNVARFPEKNAEYKTKWGKSRPEKYRAIRTASEEISDESRAWLHQLPDLWEGLLSTRRVALCHYAPLGRKEGLGVWTPNARLSEIARQVPYEIVVVGHTHTPFVRRAEGTLFINPGTVGRAFGNPTFAVLELTDAGQIFGEIHSCPISR